MNDKSNKIGRWQGAGLMATTLLGTGVFILPQMTIATAGHGALIAWLVLTLAIIPVTLVFGRLAAAFPHAAGPAYFVEKAFGASAGRTIGLLFLLVVPLGTAAAVLITFQFIDSLVKLSPTSQLLTQLSLLLVLFILNYRGIQVSAKLQFLLTLAIVAIVVILFGTSSLQQNSAQVFAHREPLNLVTMLGAAGIAFWSFLGVEAMTHLANDFKNPKKDLIPAMMIGTLLVGIIYLACTLLLLMVPTSSELAMVGIFDQLLGGFGAQIIGILGIAAGLSTVNVYTASVARLIWSFSNDGVLPGYFSKVNCHQVPVRALSVMLLTMAVVLTFTFVSGQDLEDLIAWSNGVFIIIYLASMMAAVKLLKSSNLPIIFLSCIFCLLLAWGIGERMVYALLLLIITAPLIHWQYKSNSSKQFNRAICKH